MPSLGSRWRLKLSITWRLCWLKAGRRGISHLARKVGTLASVSRPAPASPERASKVAASMARSPPESGPEARVTLGGLATAAKASSSWMVGQSRFIYGFDEGSVKNAFQLLKCLHPGFTHLWVFAP